MNHYRVIVKEQHFVHYIVTAKSAYDAWSLAQSGEAPLDIPVQDTLIRPDIINVILEE